MDIIAEITVDFEKKKVASVKRLCRGLTFKCQMCAVFCCRLGPPQLLPRDIERLKRAGFSLDDALTHDRKGLKSQSDGSCRFLSSGRTLGSYRCSIYNFRPALCRSYPFQFERSGSDLFAVKLIPCCRGLNVKSGEIVDARFIALIAESVLFELIDAGLV